MEIKFGCGLGERGERRGNWVGTIPDRTRNETLELKVGFFNYAKCIMIMYIQ